MANHDVNVMLESYSRTNLRGDITQVENGMKVWAVNTFGGLERDYARLLDWFSPLLPVGFYYKAFHTPKGSYPFWEKIIRHLAGLGSIREQAPRETTIKRYEHTDILVVGAGATGLSAALAAAQEGADVVLVDENPHPGGSLGYQRAGKKENEALLQDLLRQAQALPRLQLRMATEASGYYADHLIPLVENHGLTKLRAQALIVASGTVEQPAVFRNNDLPGVMLGSAAQRLIYRYAVKPFHHALVLAANAEAYALVLDLLQAGVKVAAIADLRAEPDPSSWAEEIRRKGIAVYTGHCVYAALSDKNQGAVKAAILCPYAEDGKADSRHCVPIECDGIVMSVGWAPAASLLYQAGATMRYDTSIHQFVPQQLPSGVFAAGRVNGVYALEAKMLDGQNAARRALAHLKGGSPTELKSLPEKQICPNHPYPIVDHPRGKNFVDFDEDLQLRDFAHAMQEGYDNIELLKRYSTLGMGPSQGKHSNMNAIRVMARSLGSDMDQVGATTARPFYHPVPLSHLAGRSFHPQRVTVLHARHEAMGAVIVEAGNWLRPDYYARAGLDRHQAVQEEVRAVRNSVGLIDVGTLGKLEISGPDAVEFLERVYPMRFANQKPGTTRYAVMLDEAGTIIDDGVVARLDERRFYATTTTTGSDSVAREMARWALYWDLKVGIVNVTGAYSAMNIAGPRSREILSPLVDIDLSENVFPFSAAQECTIAGVPARVLRVGFVSRLGYEIHVPACYGLQVWDTLLQAGACFDIRPFGVEAQRVLRLEMGHIIVGVDTDGLTHPYEAGMGWAVKMDKRFFIGQRSLQILKQRPLKKTLVGFCLSPERGKLLPRENHLVIRGNAIAGRVTSVQLSPSLGTVIGLAYVEPGMAAAENVFDIRVDGGEVSARVVKTPFWQEAA
jgi:sarcosine oxidase subunit alpha